MLRFLLALMGRHPDLPFASNVENPPHGYKAKNERHQKVIWDKTQGKWVMPQNFSDKDEVTIT